MKNRITFAMLILLSTSIFSCKKENKLDNSPYFLRAQKNNIAWSTTKGAYFAPYKTLDTLVINASKGEEHFSIVALQNNSKYVLDFNKTIFYITIGLDATIASYKLDNNETNNIVITDITNQNQLIKGNFNLTFKKVYGDVSLPTTITFSMGEFLAARAVVI